MCPCPSSCRNQAHWPLLLVMLGSFSGISAHTGDDMCQSSPYSNPPADLCITACPNMPKQHIASQHSGTTVLFPELVLTDAAPNLLSRNILKSQPSTSICSKQKYISVYWFGVAHRKTKGFRDLLPQLPLVCQQDSRL